MKIVSLLPSATEIVYRLGLAEQLCAVTHECDFPAAAASKPAITSSVLSDSQQDSLKIHKGITGLVHEGKSIYHLDEKLLADIKPDLIFTQELCDVCAVSYNIVVQAARILQGDTEVISLEPHYLRDVLANIALVAEKTGRSAEARDLIAKFEQRISRVSRETSSLRDRPRVYCMEWLNPPFAAGHWISEMVWMAGGCDELALSGQPSKQIAWQAVIDFAPEVLIFMPCGFNLQESIEQAQVVREYPGWPDLPAVKSGSLYAVDGSGYFNRPGPRLVEGLEILAQILHPEIFSFQFPTGVFEKLPA